MNFIKVSSACPVTKVSDVKFNYENIKECVDIAIAEGSKVVVFPELAMTSYTCNDLFTNVALLNNSNKYIEEVSSFSKGKDIVIVLGAPFVFRNCLYNCGFVIFEGEVLGIVPKSYIPNYSEFYEKRWFTEGKNILCEVVDLEFQKDVPFGSNLIFSCKDIKIALEICEDLWVTIPPSSNLSLAGANIICNLSASNEIIGKYRYRKSLIENQSARCISSYIYSSAGVHESTTDVLFSGHLMISENGSVLKENKRFQRDNEVITSIIDIEKLQMERLKNVSFRNASNSLRQDFMEIDFKFKEIKLKDFEKYRYVNPHPFIPKVHEDMEERCEEILNIQASALAKRIEHTGLKKAIIGISGGLDSTLALLVVIKTFDMLKIPHENILAITMPGFGTTDRTYTNAVNLCKKLNTTFKEIDIREASLIHFRDIGHDKDVHDVTYENVQARERTQILMDIANKEGGLLIGTGDLSELALGWCTYNGDQMSMYSVNPSIPKTLVIYIVRYFACHVVKEDIRNILLDILKTPVSPELLPNKGENRIVQKTEDVVGPYELHDFFLYYFIRQGADANKIKFLAEIAFKDKYSMDDIEKWLNKFITRFFTQQFKRSALPDGPKVGSISLSPRGDLRMPSDASYNGWL